MSSSRENLVRVSLPSNSASLMLEVSPQTCSLQASKWTLRRYRGINTTFHHSVGGLPDGSVSKELACKVGDLGSIPGLGRSPEKGKATHSSILAWRTPWIVHGAAKSWTRPSDFHFHFHHSHGHKASIYATRRAVRMKEVMANITSRYQSPLFHDRLHFGTRNLPYITCSSD